MLALAYLMGKPQQTAQLKAEYADFIVVEDVGFEFSGEGEFVVVQVRKQNCNTLFVAEKLAKFAGIRMRQMSYAGLKDRHAITTQWFCLHLPGMPTPDFSLFELEGVEILKVTRHNRKLRIGSLAGNYFDLLLRQVTENDEINARLAKVKRLGVPNYFTEQRFGKNNENITQAKRWANGEIKVKDRHKRSFYLSAARSAIFNQILSQRIQQNSLNKIEYGDFLQLRGSHSWFVADEQEDLSVLQQRLATGDICLTAPLIGDDMLTAVNGFERMVIEKEPVLSSLIKQERMKTARRPLFVIPQDFSWQFEHNGLRLRFYLPAGSYATAVVRELVNVEEN